MTCRATYHEGRALVLWTDTQMLLLCPYGHLYQAWPAGPEFGGSKAAIYATDPPIVRCNGVPPRAGRPAIIIEGE